MIFDFTGINWLAVAASIVAGQILLTLWFAAIFAKPWAKEYGVDTPAEHTKAIPTYVYGISVLCTALLTLGIAIIQKAFAIEGLGGALAGALFVTLFFAVPISLPGYAFLRRQRAFALAIGAQASAIVLISIILGLWK